MIGSRQRRFCLTTLTRGVIIRLLVGEAKKQANYKKVFSKDAKTTQYEITGVGNQTLISDNPNTVLGIKIQQSGTQSESFIKCGSTVLAHNFEKDYSIDLIQYPCYDTVVFDKTGLGDSAFVSITYVPYDITKSASNTPSIYQGFSYGDIVISVFVFIATIFMIFTYTWRSLSRR